MTVLLGGMVSCASEIVPAPSIRGVGWVRRTPSDAARGDRVLLLWDPVADLEAVSVEHLATFLLQHPDFEGIAVAAG